MVALRDKFKEISTKRRAFGVLLIFLYSVFFLVFLWNISSIFGEIVSSTHKRTFLVPINMNLNGTRGFYQTDIRLGLNFTYPKGTLVVNETVGIIGIAILKTNRTENINFIAVSFQNCLAYEKCDQFGIPRQAFLIFNNSQGSRGLVFDNDTKQFGYIMCDDVNATWSIEGNYSPIIGIFYNDNTNVTMTDEDVVIHVYPKEQLTQIQTNIVMVILSVAVFALSFIGVLDLFFNLWDYEPQKCNYPKKKTENDKSSAQPKQKEPKREIDQNTETKTHNHQPQTAHDKE